MYFGFNRIHDNWSLYTEAQYRSHDMGQEIEQLLLRTAMNYHISKNSSLAAGYGFIGSYDLETDIESPTTEEHRIFEQFIHKHFAPRIGFEHRVRVEQRFIGDTYKNRFRYRLFLTIPLGKKYMEPKTYFIGIYDELFINGEGKGFDRNRLYGAFGYQFNTSTNVQLGVLNQKLSNTNKWYLQVALLWNPDLRKKDKD